MLSKYHIDDVTRDLTSDDPNVKARAVEQVTATGNIARQKGMALDFADKSLSNKYVIVRRTVTVTMAMPIEYFGRGGTEKHDRGLMAETEIEKFECDIPKEDQVQNLVEATEVCRNEDLIEVSVDVTFAQKGKPW